MPFPTENEVFKTVMCPCCYEGFYCMPFNNCCALRYEAILEVDPLGTKNCFVDNQVQQCCVNVVCVFPFNAMVGSNPENSSDAPKNAHKVTAACGLCNVALIPCANLSLPLCCFEKCVQPDDSMFPKAEDVCCKTQCYCCVSGYYCKFPHCCAARVKGEGNCAPFMSDEHLSLEMSQQVCFNYQRCAYPLNPTIPSAIGCCDIVLWTNPNHVVTGGHAAEAVPAKADAGNAPEQQVAINEESRA